MQVTTQAPGCPGIMGRHMNLKNLRAANATRQKEWDKEEGITAAYRAMELGGAERCEETGARATRH